MESQNKCCNSDSLQIASYIRTWPLGSTREQMAEYKYWTAKDVKGGYLTDLIISFAQINPETSGIYFPDVDLKDSKFTNLWDEIDTIRKASPDLKMHVSVGGWGADGFSQLSANAEKRAIFIKAVVELVKEKHLEGIDIDWEFPIGPDSGLEIATSPEDGNHFILLLSELRTAFNELEKETGKYCSLSIAVPAFPWYPKKLDVKTIVSYVDTIKLMSYDFYGSWSTQTGHHACLYKNTDNKDTANWSTDDAVKMYEAAGVPKEKIVLGVAFYGRAWKGVPDEGTHGLFQKFEESAYNDGISWPDLQAFLKEDSGFTKYWDDVAKVPYLYNGDLFISYVDEEAVAAVGKYAKDNNLGGVMVWEYGHDPDCKLFGILKDSFQNK